MRRKDRQMSKKFGLSIIDQAAYGILSMVDEQGHPYSLPLSIVRLGEVLYFHSAKEGRKVEMLAKHPLVSVVFVGHVRVPDNYTDRELQELVADESQFGRLVSSVFTTEFESTYLTGRVELVDDRAEAIEAMQAICEKYTPDKMDYFPHAIEAGLGRTNVYRIEIETLTAKRKKYDAQGKEMKWGRMEDDFGKTI